MKINILGDIKPIGGKKTPSIPNVIDATNDATANFFLRFSIL